MEEKEELAITTELIKKAHGILINIEGKTERLMQQLSHCGADHYAEVCVIYNGREREYTLVDFLALLRFDVGEETMDKTEWGGPAARAKDALIAEKLMGWTNLMRREGPVPYLMDLVEMDWFGIDPRRKKKPWQNTFTCVPLYTTARNACNSMLNELAKDKKKWNVFWQHLLQIQKETDIPLCEWIIRVVNPDTICYCALKATEEE